MSTRLDRFPVLNLTFNYNGCFFADLPVRVFSHYTYGKYSEVEILDETLPENLYDDDEFLDLIKTIYETTAASIYSVSRLREDY